jgi:uncharacterized membrane protein YraQ (UPF0718 family)
VSRTLFKRGAGFIPSLAFLFASTNLVVELGVLIFVMMGWQFTLAEWIGGIVLVTIMSVLVKLTYPRTLIEAARAHPEPGSGEHGHDDATVEGATVWERLRNPQARVAIAQNFVQNVAMLWQDLALGFLIAGTLAVMVPDSIWRTLFASNAPENARLLRGAIIGPLIAIFTFVCSIGNVPLAAVLWRGGISFGGVLSFLYADLIVMPLLDIYRRYYGLRTAAYIGVIFFVTMVLAGIIVELIFRAAGIVPQPPAAPAGASMAAHFALDYTFWLNLSFGGIAAYFFTLNARHPAQRHSCH